MIRLTRFARLTVLVAVVIWLAASGPVWACPNCRDALAGDASHGGLVQGLFWSIVFLLSMPFLILAGLSGYFYFLVQRARRTAPVALTAAMAGDSPFRGGSQSAREPIPAGHQETGHQEAGHLEVLEV